MRKKSKLSLNKAKLKHKKLLNCARAKKKGFSLFGTCRQTKKKRKRKVVFGAKAFLLDFSAYYVNTKKNELSLDKAMLQIKKQLNWAGRKKTFRK